MGLIWARSLPIQLTLLFLWKPFRLRTCILRFWSSIFPLRMSIPSQIREKGSRFNCSLAVIPTLYRVRKADLLSNSGDHNSKLAQRR
ncbi:hypothetical protein CICLE_v10033192mg [Citrus x clementina]|uniref:Secreted protein n=1 Tax=Citrus clementina TaxID=85681 RepID=V4TJK4_CITCL|nr:hypothetical protein CICLE_v10033192mg [Citrus x clementina]